MPFHITTVLTDRGASFAEVFRCACEQLHIEHRMTKPYTPQTNGMVERFNGRIQREVLGITVGSHRDLERLRCCPELANSEWAPSKSSALKLAMTVLDTAKDVSQPENYYFVRYRRVLYRKPAAEREEAPYYRRL